MPERILYPALPIVDSHHHLWDFRPLIDSIARGDDTFSTIAHQTPAYLFDELRDDAQSGHNIISTVYVECGAFYRADGPEYLKSVGEVEFANGVAARSASGIYGPLRACAGIVGHADLMRADGVAGILEALIQAAPNRLRGIRHLAAHDPDPSVLGQMGHAPAGLYFDTNFRTGFAQLSRLGLSFDAWVLEPQIGDVAALAHAFPDTPIVLDHAGTPLGNATYSGRLDERFENWKAAIRDIAICPNVHVKLGGLAMPFSAFPGLGPHFRPRSEILAEMWRPYIETCIEAFGASRAMFESNYPVDRWGADYSTIWNAFKRLAAGYSEAERTELFSGTATDFYGL